MAKRKKTLRNSSSGRNSSTGPMMHREDEMDGMMSGKKKKMPVQKGKRK